ncbi:uncharacterized protein LOC118557528 [Fundulus heteroclitus]|uniref:uncharacterized protein LOC118557528 n=1 Tax=Fundulus heteroclitus TaxID=8078 RepID=UPI00165CE395|nr:uncharacterized protein LOC118557528 [Fundulus heteroclitus]
MTGEVELLCIPCDDAVRQGCLPFSSRGSKTESAIMLPVGKSEEPAEKGTKAESLSVVLIGATISSLFFLLSLLLWVVLLTVKRFKRVPEHGLKPEGLLSAANLQYESPSGHTERATPQSESASESSSPEDTTRGQNSLNHESELHPTSIVINVTTNIKPCSQKQDNIVQEGQKGFTTEEMEQKLQTIWELAQGQSIETLNYDTIQDLSLLLDSPNHIYVLRKLGLSLGVPPKLTAHFHSFQDLFQYLRTSTYTQLPQLAQAAALLPNFEVVSRIHRALVNK